MSCNHCGSDGLSHCETVFARNRALRDAWAERDRYEAALREILAGRTLGDNVHPLGPDKAMVMRFLEIAKAALVSPIRSHTSEKS